MSNTFYFTTGHKVNNTKELLEVLLTINEEEFKEHANHQKNDFYEWIKHSLKDEDLALKIKHAKTLKDTIKVLEKINHIEHTKTKNVEFTNKFDLQTFLIGIVIGAIIGIIAMALISQA